MFFKQTLLLAGLAAATMVSAAVTTTGDLQTFGGCVNALPGDAVSMGTSTSNSQCAVKCQNATPAPYQYSFSIRSGDSYQCSCSDTEAADGTYITGDYSTCTAYQQYITSESYYFTSCSDGGYDGRILSGTLASCMNDCGTAGVLFHAAQSTCFCGYTPGSQYTNCNTISYAYTNTGGASALSRRRARLEKSRQQRDSELCPSNTRACLVDADSSAYECVDTNSELESCGGCLYGEILAQQFLTKDWPLSSNSSTVAPGTGVDCTALPGALASGRGVSCGSGRCSATACAAGFSLVGDACVAN